MLKPLPFLFGTLLGVSAFCADYTADENYRYALILMSERADYAAAAEKFNEFATANVAAQDAPQALFYAAICYAKLPKDQSAAESYEKLARLYPTSKHAPTALAYGADAYFRAGLTHKAIELYSTLLQKFPQHELAITAPYWRAAAYLQLANAADNPRQAHNEFYQKAQADWATFVNCPHQLVATALNTAGLTAFAYADYPTATKMLSRLVNDFPQHETVENARYQLAESYYWQENYPAAAAEFARLFNGNFAADAYTGAGWCAYMQGDLAVAAKNFAAAARAQTDPEKAATAHFDAGAAYEEAGDFANAIGEFSAAKKSPARAVKALLRTAIIHREQAKKTPAAATELLKNAEQNLAAALTTAITDNDVEGAQAAALLGEVRLDLQNYAGAVAAFQEVLQKWSESKFAAFAAYHRALALAQQQQYDDAAKGVRELLQKFPNSGFRVPAAYLMADCQKALGNLDRAQLAWLWLVNEAPTWLANYHEENAPTVRAQARDLIIRALVNLGESYYARDGEKAAEYFARLQEEYADDPRSALANIRIGEIAEKQNDYAAAQLAYQDALAAAKKFPDHSAELDAVRLHADYRLGVLTVLTANQLTDAVAKKTHFATAIKQLTTFREKYQNNILADLWNNRARYYLAEAQAGLGQWNAAQKNYEQCYQTAPRDALADAALFGVAWCAHENKQPELAAKNWQRLIDEFPQSDRLREALYWLCVNKQAHHNYDEALYLAERLRTDFPEAATRAEIEIAKIYTATGKSNEAQDLLTEMLNAPAHTPERARALQTLGLASWQNAQPLFAIAATAEKKLKVFLRGEKFRELTGERKEAAVTLRTAWLNALGTAREAENKMIAALQALLQDYPEFNGRGAALLRLGEAYYERNAWDTAKKYYADAAATAEATVQDKAHYRLAECYLKLSETAEPEPAARLRQAAAEEFIKVAQSASALAGESAWQAAEILQARNEATAALPLYLIAQKNAETPEIKQRSGYGAAGCYLELKKYREAFEAYKTFLQNQPQQLLPEANWGAGYAALMLGAYTEARDYFMHAKADNYGGEAAAKARYGLGLIEFEQGNWKVAREEFRKVEAFHGSWAEVAALALIKAAAASHELGDDIGALKDLQRVLEKYAAASVVDEAKILMSQIKQ